MIQNDALLMITFFFIGYFLNTNLLFFKNLFYFLMGTSQGPPNLSLNNLKKNYETCFLTTSHYLCLLYLTIPQNVN